MTGPLLQVQGLRVEYGRQCAVRDVNFDLAAGESLGLVGESGAGKSTLARAVLRLTRATFGRVVWRGRDLLRLSPSEMREQRRQLQIVFQNPLGSLDPRMTAAESIGEPLRIFERGLGALEHQSRIAAMLDRVGLSEDLQRRYPHEFSGGQCQRIGIARAMIVNPSLLICDEPVSSLDVSIQGQIINLLADLQQQTGMSLLFISHNLAVVRHLCQRVMVMYAGAVVELAPREKLFAAPGHFYTRALLAAVPDIDHAAQVQGAPGAATLAEAQTSGCAFRARCLHAIAICKTQSPPLEQVVPGHWVACHRARESIGEAAVLPPANSAILRE